MKELEELEQALAKEGRVQQRQTLLKRLWKARQGLNEDQGSASPASKAADSKARATASVA